MSQKGYLKPYVYIRHENHIPDPGRVHKIDWFDQEPLYKEALSLSDLPFGEAILNLENKAFGLDLAMPRWVFYDCALAPGFVCGYAIKADWLPESFLKALGGDVSAYGEWIPISLFIVIPSIHKGEWVAHNLCAINSLVPDQDKLYGLGFLTKAFGLWYANVETCVGMTQWGKPALKLHSHYGHMEVLTSYTPIHTFAKTMTYRCQVQTSVWELFFTKGQDTVFGDKYALTGHTVSQSDKQSMIAFQKMIESGRGPFYLSGEEVITQPLDSDLNIYQKKG